MLLFEAKEKTFYEIRSKGRESTRISDLCQRRIIVIGKDTEALD